MKITWRISRMRFSVLVGLLFLSAIISPAHSTRRLTSILTPSSHRKSLPATSSQVHTRINAAHSKDNLMSSELTSPVDLWIVGCGKLGLLVAERWLELFPGAVVVGETSTLANHESISRIGAIPRLRSERYSHNLLDL